MKHLLPNFLATVVATAALAQVSPGFYKAAKNCTALEKCHPAMGGEIGMITGALTHKHSSV